MPIRADHTCPPTDPPGGGGDNNDPKTIDSRSVPGSKPTPPKA